MHSTKKLVAGNDTPKKEAKELPIKIVKTTYVLNTKDFILLFVI